jgi:hypothetical protein
MRKNILYLSAGEYRKLRPFSDIPVTTLGDLLHRAQRDIDALTYNRIVSQGFKCLTEFQQHTVRRVIAEHAEFHHEYADLIDNPLQSYGINGVSMRFGGVGAVQRDGVCMRSDTFKLLESTGLCYRGVS